MCEIARSFYLCIGSYEHDVRQRGGGEGEEELGRLSSLLSRCHSVCPSDSSLVSSLSSVESSLALLSHSPFSFMNRQRMGKRVGRAQSAATAPC